MNKLEKFEREGIFENGIKTRELISALEDYVAIYGDNPVKFYANENADVITQFSYYGNVLLIDVEERDGE